MSELNITVQYELKADTDADEVEEKIRWFVGNVSEAGLGISYRSLRYPDSARFIHVIHIADETALGQLQSKPFFAEFSGFLVPRCMDKPTVSRLRLVAASA